MSDFAKIFSKGSIQGNKNSALRIFEKLKFLQKREIPRVYIFGPTLTLFFPSEDGRNQKKKKHFWRKNFSHWGIQKLQNQDVSLLLFKWKNRITFWSHHFPIWRLSIANVFLFLILTRIFKFQVSLLFWVPHPHFDKNKFDFPMQKLILNRLTPI